MQVDNWARLRLIVKPPCCTAETEQVRDDLPDELAFDQEPDV